MSGTDVGHDGRDDEGASAVGSAPGHAVRSTGISPSFPSEPFVCSIALRVVFQATVGAASCSLSPRLPQPHPTSRVRSAILSLDPKAQKQDGIELRQVR